MRIVLRIFAMVALCLCMAVCTFASAPRLVDDADLLTASEEAMVLAMLDRVSEETDMDVVVVTVDSLEGRSARSYADDYYDYHDYGVDGALLLISMAEREWYISTTGEAMYHLTDTELDQIGDGMLSYLSSGNYAEAFLSFAKSVSAYASQSVSTVGGSDAGGVTVTEKPLEGFLVCGVIGIVIGLIVVLIMRGQLKSVRNQNAAANYVIPGSFALTGSYELFLYRNVTRRAKPQNSGGGHMSASGRSHGGRGGRF